MSVDVIVVGAGLAGLGTAWQLAQRGQRVLILEAASQPASEATAQNAGMVRRLGDDPVERALALRSHAFYRDQVQELPDFADLQVARRTGALLLLGHEPRKLHDAAAHLAAHGVALEFLDGASAIAGVLPSAVIRRAVARVGFWDAEAMVADAAALCRGYQRGLRRHQAELRCGVRVLGLIVERGRCMGVRTNDGEITAAAVVLATGAWGSQLAASAGLRRPLLPMRRTLLQSGKHDDAHADHPWVWLDDAGIYVRPQAGGWLGSPCDERLDPAKAVSGDDRGQRSLRTPTAEALALHIAKIDRLLPALHGLRWQHGWSGLRTFCPDRAPMLGPDRELAGLHWCSGLGGYGVSCGPAAAEVVADGIVSQLPAWLDGEAVRPDRAHAQRTPYSPDGDVGHARLLDVSAAMRSVAAERSAIRDLAG